MWINIQRSLYALPLLVDNTSSSCFDYQFRELLCEIQVQVLTSIANFLKFDAVEGWITSSSVFIKVMYNVGSMMSVNKMFHKSSCTTLVLVVSMPTFTYISQKQLKILQNLLEVPPVNTFCPLLYIVSKQGEYITLSSFARFHLYFEEWCFFYFPCVKMARENCSDSVLKVFPLLP